MFSKHPTDLSEKKTSHRSKVRCSEFIDARRALHRGVPAPKFQGPQLKMEIFPGWTWICCSSFQSIFHKRKNLQYVVVVVVSNYLSDGKLVTGKIPFGGVEAGGLFVRPCAFTMKRFAPGVLGLHVGVFGGKRMIPVSFSKKIQESFRWWKLSLTWCLYNPLQVRSFRFLDGFHQPRSWSTSWPLVPMNRKIHPGGSEDFMWFFFWKLHFDDQGYNVTNRYM